MKEKSAAHKDMDWLSLRETLKSDDEAFEFLERVSIIVEDDPTSPGLQERARVIALKELREKRNQSIY